LPWEGEGEGELAEKCMAPDSVVAIGVLRGQVIFGRESIFDDAKRIAPGAGDRPKLASSP